jgi:hypothetical protein
MTTTAPTGGMHRSRSIRRAIAARCERQRITQLVLRRLPRTIRSGTYPAAIKPFVNDMEREAEALVQHLGGPENASEVAIAIVRDAAICGATLAVAFTRLAQRGGDDIEAMAKIASLAGARGRLLQMLGIERRAKNVALDSYLDAHAEVAGALDPEVFPPDVALRLPSRPENDEADRGVAAGARENAADRVFAADPRLGELGVTTPNAAPSSPNIPSAPGDDDAANGTIECLEVHDERT